MQDMDGISQLEGQESVDGEDVAPLGQAFEIQLLARRNEFIGVVVGCAQAPRLLLDGMKPREQPWMSTRSASG